YTSDRIVQRLEVLDVHRCQHADAGVEDVEHVLIALLMTAAERVGVRELVDDTELLFARDDGVDVHLLERDPAVLDSSTRNRLEIADERFGIRAAVRFDKADDDVDAFTLEGVRVL